MKSNVVSISEAREWRAFDNRLMQNALILNAAIADKALTKTDIKTLSELINNRVYSNRIVCLLGRLPEASLQKLIGRGYLIDNGPIRGPIDNPDERSLRLFELTDREKNRDWFKDNGVG
jgi:hypothetical protein